MMILATGKQPRSPPSCCEVEPLRLPRPWLCRRLLSFVIFSYIKVKSLSSERGLEELVQNSILSPSPLPWSKSELLTSTSLFCRTCHNFPHKDKVSHPRSSLPTSPRSVTHTFYLSYLFNICQKRFALYVFVIVDC